MKPAEKRLQALEKRKLTRTYLPGTDAYDIAITEFFFKVRARCGCTACLQANDEGDNTHCIPGCETWEMAEADEAELLNQDDILERILFDRIMIEK